MGLYRSLNVLMGYSGFLLVLLRPYGSWSLWVLMNPIGPCRSIWCFTGVYGFLWISMGS